MVTQYLFFVLTVYFLSFFWGLSAQDGGQYEIVLETIKNCAEKGTGEMSFTSTARKDENGTIFHTGTINMPYGLNDNFKATADASIWINSEWKPVGVLWKLSLSKACNQLKCLVPAWFDILKAANVQNVDCPIKKGKYSFVDYHVDGSMDAVKSLKYGKYRVRVSFTRRDKKIGCVCYIIKIIAQN